MIELCWPSSAREQMKKIGIVGGVAWPSTVDYYAEICRRSEQRHLRNHFPGPPSTPEMTIESLNLSKTVSYLGVDGDEESWSQFDEYHRAALRRLESCGADFALMASNTPHHRYETIVRGVGIPVIDMFEVVAKESARIGAMQVVILGTALTMGSQRFHDAFARHGITAAGPEDETARSMTIQLIADLQRGKLEGAADLGMIAKLATEQQIGGRPVVCLACTELPLAFPHRKAFPWFEADGILYINTTIVHAGAAFDFAVE
jgi:aspartate racemase